MQPFEVVLEDDNGEIVNWGPDEALDEGHAADLAREKYPDHTILEVMEVEG